MREGQYSTNWTCGTEVITKHVLRHPRVSSRISAYDRTFGGSSIRVHTKTSLHWAQASCTCILPQYDVLNGSLNAFASLSQGIVAANLPCGSPLSNKERAFVCRLPGEIISERRIPHLVGRSKQVLKLFWVFVSLRSFAYEMGGRSSWPRGCDGASSGRSALGCTRQGSLVTSLVHPSACVVFNRYWRLCPSWLHEDEGSPAFTQRRKADRIAWAHEHVCWPAYKWRRVICSDKKRFMMDFPDVLAHYWVYSRLQRITHTSRQRGRGVMVWALFSTNW